MVEYLNNLDLRKRLQEITDTYVEGKSGEQPRLVSDLAKIHPHSIRLLELKDPENPKSLRFNCHEYAFGLRNSSKVEKISFTYQDIFPGPDYVTWLIARVLTEINFREVQNEDVIIYFSASGVTHSGIWRDMKITSKWGECHLWEHGVYEVPLCYGSDLLFFKAFRVEKCEESFIRYAKLKGQEIYPSTFELPFDEEPIA